MESTIKDCYEPFGELLAKKNFERLFLSLSADEQARFANASHMYRRAMKCKNCDGDVCLALLCSSVEAITVGSKTISFKDWLVENRLETLVDKSESQLKKAINHAYEEYMLTACREGIAYAFRKFLFENCPLKLRNNPPLIFYQDITPSDDYRKLRESPSKLSERLREPKSSTDRFQRALKFVYSRFRCYFLHEAVGLAGTYQRSKSIEEAIEDSISPRFDFDSKKEPIRIAPETTDWFSEVVKQSLVQYLRRSHDR